MVVPDSVKDVAEAHSGNGCLVGRAHFVPQPNGAGVGQFRPGGVTVGKAHPPLGGGGAGHERFALEPGGDTLQLVGRRTRPVDVAGRHRDVHLCRQEWRALQVVVGRSLLGWHSRRLVERLSNGIGR
ncbi:MAG: hypothetical protein M3Q68_10420 [Actinomycetota bacterium]|nr:hypothetical protein [Actinomycetota bacterium]